MKLPISRRVILAFLGERRIVQIIVREIWTALLHYHSLSATLVVYLFTQSLQVSINHWVDHSFFIIPQFPECALTKKCPQSLQIKWVPCFVYRDVCEVYKARSQVKIIRGYRDNAQGRIFMPLTLTPHYLTCFTTLRVNRTKNAEILAVPSWNLKFPISSCVSSGCVSGRVKHTLPVTLAMTTSLS